MRPGYDYIVVGAGTAGCVLANRLSADSGCRVLLCEAGLPDRSWILHMPAGLRSIFKPGNRYNWGFETEPQAGLEQRRIAQPRGKALGGSSSINGMTFLRGHPQDYDAWAAAGCTGWSWSECLPYFRRSESYSRGGNSLRGGDGPVGVQVQEQLGPLNRAFLAAGQQAGFPLNTDPNAGNPEGVSRFDMSVRGGLRSSSSRSYLRPTIGRPNLDVLTQAMVQRIVFDGDRATGVELFHNGATRHCQADAEVLLCAGAFASPQLLMLSGIGPESHLQTLGIPCKHALSGVGDNFQDHLEAHIQVRTDCNVSLNRELHWHRMLLAGLQWFAFKRGVAAVNQCHVGAFVKTRETLSQPDIQMHFFPVFFGDGWLPRAGINGYRLGVGVTRPTSRGRLRLRSTTPGDMPRIDPNYLATESDRTTLREGLRVARRILAQPAFETFQPQEHSPGPNVVADDQLDAFIRAHATSAYHPCGTCRMGTETDETAVVDPQLRVRGGAGLRVVDAAIMPSVVSSNINACVFMIAEKAADLIRGQGTAPASERSSTAHHAPASSVSTHNGGR